MTATPVVLETSELAAWVDHLAQLDEAVGDAERIDRLRVLEKVKAAAAAAQARVTVAFDATQRAVQAAVGVPAKRQGVGVAAQVALARRDSPARGARHLGLAKVLVRGMPHTLAALTRGRLSEWRATLLARETACLSAEHRADVDRLLAGDTDRLERLGDPRLVAERRSWPIGWTRARCCAGPRRPPRTDGCPSVPRRTRWPT